jgi:hypothetical protein
MQHIDHRCVAIRVLPGRQRFCLLPALAASEIRNELEQHVRRWRQRYAIGERLTQGPPADWKIWRCVERGKDRVDQRGIVGGINPEGIADDIIETAFGEIELDVPGFFFGTRLVETAARDECRVNWIVARAAGRSQRHGRRLPRRGLGACRRWRRCELLIELLEHAGGVLAARHAQVQPLFFFREQRVGVILAIVAALAAILLRHRRHHLPPQRPAIGELHAFGQRHGRIVPGRAVIGILWPILPRIDETGQQFRHIGGGQRRDAALQPVEAGEQAIEPGALLRRKWRGFGEERWDRRPLRDAHSAASCATMVLSASISWRRAKAMKLSACEARCAR